MKLQKYQKCSKVTRGLRKAEFVLKNARIVNVFTREILEGDIAIQDGMIVGIGNYQGEEETDLGGRYVCPGFIDSHLHLESTLVTPAELVPTKEIAGQYRVWTCLPYEDTRLVEVYRIEVEPGGVYISGSHGEKTREYLAVMEGVLTLECHGEKYEIHRDQVFKFETDQEHIYRNTGKEKACCTCFFLDYH